MASARGGYGGYVIAISWPPREPWWRKPARYFVQFYHRPIPHWLFRWAVIPLLAAVFLFIAVGIAISFDDATQFMTGLENPYSKPSLSSSPTPTVIQQLSPFAVQQIPAPSRVDRPYQGLAIAMRIAGWVAIPALIGGAVGLTAAETLRRMFNRSDYRLIVKDKGNSCYISNYVGQGEEDDATLKEFCQAHGYDPVRTQRCWKKLFYNAWHTNAVYGASDRGSFAAKVAISYIQLFDSCLVCYAYVGDASSGLTGLDVSSISPDLRDLPAESKRSRANCYKG